MPNRTSVACRSLFFLSTPCLLGLFLCVSAWAAQPDRITVAIDDNQTVVLKGSVHPKATKQFDQGPVDPSMKLGHVTLQISPSPAQQAALDSLLAEQQDPASPNYHKWLAPEQFAARFGMSRTDSAKITNWLRSRGFTIVQVARARNWVAFYGTASQLESALHTQIHYFVVDGEQHYANATDISLPKALAGVVTSVRGLDDFLWKSSAVRRLATESEASGAWNAFYSNGSGNFLAPDDIATIYDIKPLFAAGIDGTNVNIVIVGQTDIVLADITQFRSGFNLPAIKLQQTLTTGCVDPGTTGDLAESDLDLEWSGAVARNANIIFVKCDIKHGGVFASAQYAIDNNLAPVISMSYGGCEPANGQTNAMQIRTMIQQANSSGITFMSSAGDAGAAACDSGKPPATKGLEVNLPASVPETTALGGSEFNEGSGTYWGSNGPNFGSALSYIPEEGWNDTALGGGFASTGGGKSIYFGKPAWQSGSDGARDVPDVTITASADHDGYLLCSGGSCANGIVNDTFIVGGTSASAPVFAGIVTLLNQYLVKNGLITNPGLSNINPTLYQLIKSNPSAFHDITTGNNIVPCTPGTPIGYPPAQQCPASGQFGYSAGTGYDLVTGLGSVDVYNLVTGWSSAVSTTTTLSISPASPVVAGTSVTMTATVKPSSSTKIPTGSVTFSDPVIGKLGTGALNSSGVATFTSGKLAGASYSITATYSGDTNFAGSASLPVPYNVQDFRIAANPATVTVTAPGQSGTATLTITPLGGFSQTLSYSCTGLPSEATCTFAAASATSETLTIATMSPSARLDKAPLERNRGGFYALLLPGFLGLVLSAGNKRTRRGIRLFSLIAALMLSTLWMPACGGGTSTPRNPGTPIGTSTVTVTATTGGTIALMHNAIISLTVQ
ncbi:MAG TPA: protease pro-enzyme activation domain-containing protein [Terriglobales bacterium]|nr:protease pro-enzyme activation domain-containing protein [Terriglobales bacterium]